MNWQYILKAGPWNVKDKGLYYESTFMSKINPTYYRNFEEAAIEKSVNSMLNNVWADLGGKVDVVPGRRAITIEGESGTPYEIKMKISYPDYCKFDVVGSKETPIGYLDVAICIDPAQYLPYGDMLAANILALVNDSGSAARIKTIDAFLNNTYYGGIYCEFCHDNDYEIPDYQFTNEHSCPNCEVFSCRLDISNVEVEVNSQWFQFDTFYHEFTCPICRDEIERLSSGNGYCEKDRLFFVEDRRFPLMRIRGELAASEDFKDLYYQGKSYRYIGDGIDVEEEE